MQLAARHELVGGGVDRFLPALLLTLFRHERILSSILHVQKKNLFFVSLPINCGVPTFSWQLDIWIRHSGGQGLVRDELACRCFMQGRAESSLSPRAELLLHALLSLSTREAERSREQSSR